MKQDRFGKAGVLSPEQIHLLFSDGLIQLRDRALFGVCLYTGCRIGEACTLLTSDVVNASGPKPAVLFRWHQTKGKRDTEKYRCIPSCMTIWWPMPLILLALISSPVGMTVLICG